MRCSNCGKEISSQERFCSNCGENNEYYIERKVDDLESEQKQKTTDYYQQANSQGHEQPKQDIHFHYNQNQYVYEDKLGVGLGILCFLIPLVGIIIYFSDRRTEPKKANAAVLVSVISIVIYTILSIV